MTDHDPCPTCGTPVPTGGLCPRCLLGVGLDEGGAAPPSPEEIGKEFPAFEILEVLGQGGMGIVYKARQKSLDRLVALKVLPPEIAREPGFAERFTREARTLARLHHEHIVAIHEFGETNGLYYLVMEFVDGPNLRQVIRDGKLEASQALAIVPQICEALQYAHDQGVVHRDIKPENVLLDRAGRVKIADFGLARLVQRAPLDLTLTRAGQVMGTLQYMAPEQYREPDSVDHRADIFSLGVVFYEMLTGDLPVGTFPPPSTRAGVDARLDGVVLRALERERDRRWQKASDMGTRIDTIASGADLAPAAPATSLPTAKPDPLAAPAGVRARISRLALAGCLGGPLALSIVALAGISMPSEPHGAPGLDADAANAATSALIAGLAVSAVAWVRIRTSQGLLLGRSWAIAGTVIPAVLLLAVIAVAALRTARDSEREPVEIAASAARVVGGPPNMADDAKARIVSELEALWLKLKALALSEPNPAVKALSLAKSDQRRFESMSPAERQAAGKRNRLGIPFVDLAWIEDPGELRLAWVALDADGARARVVVSKSRNVLAFAVRLEDGTWYPAIGPVEMEERALKDGDRNGWIDHGFYAPGTDPAERVTGGPASLTDADRDLLAQEIYELWGRSSGPTLKEFLIAGNVKNNLDLRLYHVVLDESGTSGRLVVSDGRHTVAASFTQEKDVWLLLGKDAELRVGGAGPEDRDGYLFR